MWWRYGFPPSICHPRKYNAIVMELLGPIQKTFSIYVMEHFRWFQLVCIIIAWLDAYLYIAYITLISGVAM